MPVPRTLVTRPESEAAPWVAALQARGWLAPSPELEPNPDGPGKVGRWRLTDVGRAEWAAMKGGAT